MREVQAIEVIATMNQEKGETVAEKLSDKLNVMSFSSKTFAAEMKKRPMELQELFYEIALTWIGQLSHQKDMDWYDERNERSVNFGSLIKKLHSFELAQEEIQNASDSMEKIQQMVFQLATDHRALQQTFSEVVFDFLDGCTSFSSVQRNFLEEYQGI